MEVIQPTSDTIRTDQQDQKTLEKDPLLQCVVALLFLMGLIIISITVPLLGALIASGTLSLFSFLPLLAVPFVLMFLPYVVVQLTGGFTTHERQSPPPRRWQRYPIVNGRLVLTEPPSELDIDESVHIPWMDDSSEQVPDWLLPLLKSRTTTRSTHDLEPSSTPLASTPQSSDTPPLSPKELEDRIRLLETRVVKLQKLLKESTNASQPKETQSDSVLHEIAALKVLLEALEEQYGENRIPKAFYRRKKRQLKSQLKAALKPVQKA